VFVTVRIRRSVFPGITAPQSTSPGSTSSTGQSTVPGGESRELEIRCAPATGGEHRATLRLDLHGIETPVPLRVYGGGPVVELDFDSIDFGAVTVGARVRRELAVANAAVSDPASRFDDLVIAAIEVDPPSLRLDPVPFPVRLEPGSFAPLAVSFQAADERPVTGTLNLLDEARRPLATVPLAARGTPDALCDPSTVADTLRFGLVDRGRLATRRVIVRNDLAAPCHFSGAAASPFLARYFALADGSVPPRLLAPGEELVLTVESSPPMDLPLGTMLTGRLAIYGLATKSVTIAARAAEPCLHVLPSPLDFGAVETGRESAPRELTLRNSCSYPVQFSVSRGTGSSAEFRFTAPAATTLQPMQELPLPVTYLPSDAGRDEGSVELAANANWTGQEPIVAVLRGVAGATTDESFVQGGPGKVDLLVVIGGSAWMSAIRAEVGARFESLVSAGRERGLDFQVALTSASSSGSFCSDPRAGQGRLFPLDGSGPRLFGAGPPGSAGDFAHAMSTLEDDCTSHVPLEAALLAFGWPRPQAGNLTLQRRGSLLSLLVASDRDDESPGPLGYCLRRMRNLAEDAAASRLVAGLLGGPREGRCTHPVYGSIAGSPRQTLFAELTGGPIESLCSGDVADALRRLSPGLFGLRSRWLLKALPAPDSLRVFVDGVETGAWSYSETARAIDFSPTAVPVAGSTIRVTYTVRTR